MKALIFGSNGQDGKFLTDLLRRNNVEVIGISRSNAEIVGSVADFALVGSIIKLHQPEYIFHFAANSTTRHTALFDNHSAISTGTLNVLEAVRLYSKHTRVFLSGSAMQFKNDGLPIDEHTEFEASSAYSVARIQSIYAGRYYRSNFGLQVYTGYFFNHDSELRSENHVNQKVAATVKRISQGSKEKLEIGNLEVLKEFNYAGDMVEAVWRLVNQEVIYEAVIGCAEVHSIKEWTEYCFKKRGLNWENHTIINKAFIPEYSILVSNPSLIKQVGWQPKLNFFELADLMMSVA